MSDALPHLARRGRRAVRHQVDVHRPVQPRPGRAAAVHRLAAVGPAVDGLVGHLRPRLGEREPARLRRPDLQRRPARAAARAAGAAAFCRRSTRACSAARRATRCCTSPTRRAWTATMRRRSLDALRDLNEMQAERTGQPGDATRIAQYELAFRMQTVRARSDGHLARAEGDRSRPTAPSPAAASFANNCLLARRLVEKGVRFVQLFDWGWDFHGTGPSEDIRDGLTKKCATMDRPVAALIKDLQAARAARRHAGRLERRVRPHAVPRGPHRRQRHPRPRSLSRLLHACSWPAAA